MLNTCTWSCAAHGPVARAHHALGPGVPDTSVAPPGEHGGWGVATASGRSLFNCVLVDKRRFPSEFTFPGRNVTRRHPSSTSHVAFSPRLPIPCLESRVRSTSSGSHDHPWAASPHGHDEMPAQTAHCSASAQLLDAGMDTRCARRLRAMEHRQRRLHCCPRSKVN